MNHRLFVGILLALCILGIVSGYFLINPELIGLCPTVAHNCLNDALNFGLGFPLYLSIRWLLPLFLLLFFVRKEIFTTWWKVILPFAILGLILIVISPPLPDLLTPDRTKVTDLVVKGIVIVSLIVIAWKYWRLSVVNKRKA
jgi:hypothetical protein